MRFIRRYSLFISEKILRCGELKIVDYEDFLKKWSEGKRKLELTLIPEDEDDLWHLYNIIEKGDLVRSRTSRTIKPDEAYSRPKKGERVALDVTVEAESVSWDRFSNKLRVHGIVREAPERYEVTGSHHTLALTPNKPVKIMKDHWSKVVIDRLERSRRTKRCPIIVVSIDDENLCIANLREFGVDVKLEEKMRLPGKMEVGLREKAKKQFFKKAASALKQLLSELDGEIVIIGPGFIKNDFYSFLKENAPALAAKVIEVKSVNNSGLGGIYEALRSGVLLKAISKIRLSLEMESVREFLRRLGRGGGDVAYGLDEVLEATDLGAVEKLLIVDETWRGSPDEIRTKLEELMITVERKGGEVMFLSSESEAGLQILSLGGVAALLRFPMK